MKQCWIKGIKMYLIRLGCFWKMKLDTGSSSHKTQMLSSSSAGIRWAKHPSRLATTYLTYLPYLPNLFKTPGTGEQHIRWVSHSIRRTTQRVSRKSGRWHYIGAVHQVSQTKVSRWASQKASQPTNEPLYMWVTNQKRTKSSETHIRWAIQQRTSTLRWATCW